MSPTKETSSRSASASSSSSSPERSAPPDIIASSSPTLSRRKDFKAAARKRSQEKNRLKKSSLASSKKSVEEMSEISEVSTEEGVSDTNVKAGDQSSGSSTDTISSSSSEQRQTAAASLSLELHQETSQTWSSVVTSPGQETLVSPSGSARDILIQKRVSLSHTPDIVRVFQKESLQQEQHEFQRVNIFLLQYTNFYGHINIITLMNTVIHFL